MVNNKLIVVLLVITILLSVVTIGVTIGLNVEKPEQINPVNLIDVNQGNVGFTIESTSENGETG